jgi:hypothetical protein
VQWLLENMKHLAVLTVGLPLMAVEDERWQSLNQNTPWICACFMVLCCSDTGSEAQQGLGPACSTACGCV